MKKIEDVMNNLTDSDMSWWPFLFLRPAKNECMDNIVVAKMSFCFGILYSLVILTLLSVLGRSINMIFGGVLIIFFMVIFFVLYRFIFSIFWNRRAKRLAKE
jgi:hypothetical protein